MFRRYILVLLAAGGLSLGAVTCAAQSALLDIPRDSQHSILTQRVGITDITINYHRPLVKGRTIWGKVVPYGEVWRSGANENTTITFTDPVSVEGQPLPVGTYGLHTIPGEHEWIIIFSRISSAWGSFTYKQDNDALRVTVKPHPSEFHEALTYDFDDVKRESAVATLSWEKIAVPFTIAVDVNETVKASLHKQLQGQGQYTWEAWDDAANYLLANKFDLDEALQYEETSIQTEPRFDNFLTKSQILEAMGRKEESQAAQNQALARATAAQLYTWGRQLQQQGQQDQAFDVLSSGSQERSKRLASA